MVNWKLDRLSGRAIPLRDDGTAWEDYDGPSIDDELAALRYNIAKHSMTHISVNDIQAPCDKDALLRGLRRKPVTFTIDWSPEGE